MRCRLPTHIVATAVVVVFAVGIWSTGDEVNLGWLRFYSFAVLAATALLWLWDRVLWKVPAIQRLGSVPRDIGGTWKGTLESSWKDPESGLTLSPKSAYLVVRQTASNVSVILLTDESKSVSSLGFVSRGEGTASLDYIYFNRPGSKIQSRSRMHDGSASLAISGLPPTRLVGHDWADRDTQGELTFDERRKRAVEDFRAATELF
jgi:SMODS-associating 2TM, beta-strand rich effector domain